MLGRSLGNHSSALQGTGPISRVGEDGFFEPLELAGNDRSTIIA